ncbi:hypothetical protein [Anaerotignum sp. MB30-C6]|uniref:hypothetical protein n=1 Tax=Anaerotignum sp. MB30-C6 TaxID=3070814 RepID=UPI0027DC02EF|nr:hypothetical protein [Anaerotignum sp. MB30-C6]WMI82031.1 hypothetical protein RBQ60_04680 [Anaerotignum sp. MB30-C6]
MGTIKTSIQMFDGMTPGLKKMTRALDIAIAQFEALDRASTNCIDTRSLQVARKELNLTKVAFQQVEASIREAGEQQKKFSKNITSGPSLSGEMKGMFKNQQRVKKNQDTSSGEGPFDRMKGTFGNVEAASGIRKTNLNLGTGVEFPEQNQAQAKPDKVGAAVETLSSVIPQGYTSPDELKNSMFAAADEIDTKFSGLSQVLGSVWSSATGEQTEAIKVSDLLANSWSSFAPLIMGAATAMNLYNLAMDAGRVAQVLQSAATVIGTAFNGSWTTSVFTQTAAQQGLNAAILTCPITWIILGIIALIAILYAVVAAINKFTGSSISATGIIAGVFGVLGASIYNGFAFVWNFVAAFVNFFGNVFQNPIAAIQVLFYDLAINVIGYIRNIAEGIEAVLNKIPGIELDITSNLDGLLSEIQKKSQDVKDKAGFEDVMQKLDYKSYSGAFANNYDKGKGLFGGGGVGNDGMDELLQNTANTAGNTGVMVDSMEISQEDLRYLRDISERDAINRFTTAQVNVDFKNEAKISSDLDIDGVMNKFTDVLREAIYTQAEEVHVLV